MGLFAKLSSGNAKSTRLTYHGENQHAKAIFYSSEIFLSASCKSQPTTEEQFNSVISFTVVDMGYSCLEFSTLKNFEGAVVAVEVRKTLSILQVRPDVLSQDE